MPSAGFQPATPAINRLQTYAIDHMARGVGNDFTSPPMAQQPLGGQGLLTIQASRSNSDTPHSDSSEQVIGPSQIPLPDNTQHSQQTDIHAPGGIQTHNPSKRAAADTRLRPRGHWDRHNDFTYSVSFISSLNDRNSLHVGLSHTRTHTASQALAPSVQLDIRTQTFQI
jgi:hypothetical protein